MGGLVLAASLYFVHAQSTASLSQSAQPVSEATDDLSVMLQALERTTPLPASAAPVGGNFYTVQHGENWPPLPGDILNLPFWPLGDGFYVLDDRNVNYAALQSTAAAQAMTMSLMDGMASLPTTNDLWLQIITVTNNTAALVIHPPWNVTNGTWGLYFKTNLAIPYNWTWLMTCAPGQTNLFATNLPPEQGFFMLGPPTAIRDGFTNNSLAPSDDDYTGSGNSGTLLTNLLATISFPINFFGTSYTNLYVNNNGNVTFDALLSDFTPDISILGEVQSDGLDEMIAPFWADVDTRGSGSGVVTYGTNTVDGRVAFGVNWIGVGYYSQEVDKTNSFQMVMIDRSDRTNGDFDLEFNYSQIQWEAGDLSGGSDGLGGSSARAGYASASGSTFEINGSGIDGSFLDSNTTNGLIYTNFNSTVPGRYVFQFHNGIPLGTP